VTSSESGPPSGVIASSLAGHYFRQLFKLLGSDKAVIFLKDVQPQHLDLFLQYVYKGEIKVQVVIRIQISFATQLLFQESELANFLSAAQALEVKGLCEKNHSKPRPTPGPHSHPVVPAIDRTPYMQSRANHLDTLVSEPGHSMQGPTEPQQQEHREVKKEMSMTVEHHTVEQDDDDVPDYGAQMVCSDSAVVAGYE
jgi:hypothetical protein